MRKFVSAAMALSSLAVFAPAIAQAQAKPVVAVLYFDNNSIGKDHADYDGVGKGIADILITDMASNPNVRVVERERIQALITEQNLTKAGAIDPQTAIRLGKIIGAQYMITGGFMSDGKGTFVLTARSINVETSAISNPQRLTDKGGDVLALIAQLSAKVSGEMKLPALHGDAGGAMGAMPAGQPAAAEKAAEPAKTAEAKPAEPKAAPKVAQAKSNKKMDMKTVMLLSKALEEEDAGNRTKAVELYSQVVDKFPEYAPAQQKIKKLSQS
jgi:TolB-like protein